jgi:hypothetical protein
METDEFTALAHLMNLVLDDMHEIAAGLIAKHLLSLNLSSNMFQANLSRIYALCLQSNFFDKLTEFMVQTTLPKFKRRNSTLHNNASKIMMDRFKTDFEAIREQLARSLHYFKEQKCFWGIGLVKYQHAYFHDTILSKIKDQEVAEAVELIELLGGDSEKTLQQCIKSYNQAYNAFSRIKHHRGIALSAFGMVENMKRLSNTEQDSEDSFKSDDSFESVDLSSDSSEETKNDGIGMVNNFNNRFRMTKIYKQSL